MPRQYQITRIKKPGGSDSPTDHIEEVFVEPSPSLSTVKRLGIFDEAAKGFIQSLVDAPRWITVEEVIKSIESGTQYFYTDKAGNRADVIVNQRQTWTSGRWIQGRKFIQTKVDATKVDNLLSLPNDYGK